MKSHEEGKELLRDPFWFQDGEGRCLGIGGFGECGETLWRVRRKEQGRQRKVPVGGAGTRKKRQRTRQGGETKENTVCVWPFFCERDSSIIQSNSYDDVFEVGEEEGLALELVDVDDYAFGGLGKQRRRRRRFLWVDDGRADYYEPECLVSFPSEGKPHLQIGSCSSQEAWMWHVNRDGVLVRGLTKSEKRKLNRRRWIGSPKTAGSRPGLLSNSDVDVDVLCLHKVNSTGASLLPCQVEKKHASLDNSSALVGFSLVRYPSATYRMTLNSSNGEDWTPWITLEGSHSKQPDIKQLSDNTTTESSTSDHHMPSSRTHASNAKRHVEVKSTRNMLHTGIDQGSPRKHHISARTSASHIRDAPATTVDGLPFHTEDKKQLEKIPDKIKTALLHREKSPRRPNRMGDRDQEATNSESSSHHRPIKIPVHPYIEASKDGVWVDPLTSLEYPTDLCEYLGQTKAEAGRHTLMGVGQYFRTAFNIKVSTIDYGFIYVVYLGCSPLLMQGLWRSTLCGKARCPGRSEVCSLCHIIFRRTPKS